MPRRIPSLNWLRVFEAAARAGSFARAAEALAMSPPAVGQQIKALETHLGHALFERGAHSVTLTAAGRDLLPAVAQSLHTMEVATVSLFGEHGRTPLTVQCSMIFAAGWLAPRLASFHKDNPQIQLRLTSAVQDYDFRPAESDLRITFGLPPGSQEDNDPLFGEVLTPVAPPWIAEQIKAPKDIARWPLVEIATHRTNWFALLAPDGPEPDFIHTDTTLAALSIAAGGAIALDRQPATGDLAARHGLVPCLPGLSVRGVQGYALVYAARTALSRPARVFRDWLLEQVGDP
ncbi:MAG: LysR family transcriptional regulator [Pseudomonadota bacterium]